MEPTASKGSDFDFSCLSSTLLKGGHCLGLTLHHWILIFRNENYTYHGWKNKREVPQRRYWGVFKNAFGLL